ncbi:MAG: hypothetical protein HY071_04930 [Chloroflexi bacterium]|nr:hypothetical protein [Chloroflexota bacterium]
MKDRRGERGQALVVSVLLIGVGAVAVAGLLETQSRLLARVRLDRAGEAAAQAAGAVAADEQLAFVRGRAKPPLPDEEQAFARSVTVREHALTSAQELARANDAPPPDSMEVRDTGRELVVEVALGGRSHRVAVPKVPCCPR